MTYMVMETHLSYSVVLDEAGRFFKVANMNHEVGQTVEQVLPIDVPEKKVVPFRLISAIGTVAACFILMFSMYWSNYMSPFASIYLTINPEVRLEISRKDTVVGLEGVNEDGVSLIAGYSFRGKSITQVADDLLDRAIDMGFLSDGGMVTVNIDSPDEMWFTNTGITLRQNLNDHLSERMTVTIEVKQYTQSADPAFSPDETQVPTVKPTEPVTQPSTTPPTTSGDSGYGDSSYSDPDNDSGYGKQTAPPPTSNNNEYGDSAYNPSAPSDDDRDSRYSEPEPENSGDSTYQEPDNDGSDSGYDVTDDDTEVGDTDDDD